MMLLHLFWAFFLANLLGYGGGPPSIPLIQSEVVDRYGWLTLKAFGDLLALGNALPGPIATKLAAAIGYQQGGGMGAVVALTATVAPSAVAMVALFRFADRFKDAPQVQAMARAVQPVVAVLLGILAVQFFSEAFHGSGWVHTAVLAAASYWTLERLRIHPALVIAGSLVYGALFLR